MTDYLHHVPGRLRIRSRTLRGDTASRNAALRKLRALSGVRSVRHNAKAGSVTVCYDIRVADPDGILELIDNECLRFRSVRRPAVSRHKPATTKSGSGLTAEIGRMALGALVSRSVGYSISSLFGVRT